MQTSIRTNLEDSVASRASHTKEAETPYFLRGEGEMARLTREHPWEETPLGSPEHWPQELKTTLDILLHSDFPMFLFWGEELRCFYNDAYRPSLGMSGKHPSLLGMPAKEAWSEIWDEIEPLLDRVIQGEGTVYLKDQFIPFYRNGVLEDMYWTFAYSPVRNAEGEIVAIFTVCNETTQEVARQKSLQRSEERFRSMAEDTDIYIVTGNEEGNATYFNPAWTRLTGMPMDALTGFQWEAIVHPEDREPYKDLYLGALQEKQAFTGEVRVRAQDGQYHWLLSNATPRFHTDGRFIGFIGVFTDITERKNMEEELKFFKIMADTAMDPIILITENASFRYLNKAALEKWGYSEEEARHLTVPDVDPWYDLEAYTKLFRQIREERVPLFETIHKNKAGEIYPVEIMVTPVELGGQSFMLAIARDITARQKAEKRVKESEKQFRLLAEQSPVWVWMTDEEINVQYANQPMLNYLGLKEVHEFTGKVWETLAHPDDLDMIYEVFGKAQQSKAPFQFELRVLQAATGEFEWHYIRAVPRIEEGQIVGFIGTAVNVDEQKEFTRRLEEEVAERTEDLEHTNQELERMNKELESFAYISSHDLQEPLRKIQMFSSQILERDFESLSERSRDKFQRMQAAARRMQALIRDLLAYSRSQSCDMVYEPLDLTDLARKVVQELEEELESKEGVVRIEELPEAQVIVFQIEQLLYNLISNSLKFVSPDREPEIRVSGKVIPGSELPFSQAHSDQDYCQLSIKDNGIGFEQKYADRIFEVFQRLHGKTEFTGTGIGLSIVKKIVDNHHGFISAEGEKDQGATFTIYLPVAQDAAAQAEIQS